MTNNLKTKFMLLGLFLSMIVFSGCGSVVVAIVDTDGQKTFYEQELIDGNIYITSDSYAIPGSSTIYITGVSVNKSILMYKRSAKAYSLQDIDVDIVLYENGTQYNTVPLETFNKNRNLEDGSTFVIYESNTNPLSVSGAIELPFANKLKGDKKALEETSDTADYIMKENEIYILSITNNAPQPVDLILYWSWIEIE